MVPPTASTSSALLNILGYPSEQYAYYVTYANYDETQSVTVLEVRGIDLIINWPCAGIHSVIIFTLMILVFAKNSQFSPISKIIIAAIGTTGTFLANAARISYKEILYITTGQGVTHLFHDYYDALFYMAWFMSFILMVTYANSMKKRISLNLARAMDKIRSLKKQ
jgi:exosortase/archaeosortase family protein